MTETEKLKALLAEARETLSLHDGVVECDHPECRLYRFFAKGIDALLADTTIPCGDCGHPLTEVRPGKHQCDVCDDLRLHKEERLRLRGIETRLTLELNKARELLREAWTQLAAGAQPYDSKSWDDRVNLLKQMNDAMQTPKRVQAKCYCGKDSVYYGFCSECSKKLVCHD